ncbi:hypothetical protein L210DRAFT_3722646 [Boletus edulis BED1]|uniref:Serine-tRNA synthetase type1 N-terminal domain-containing protein n=1 Tax=Boletus edulis BED1 TaxID=1328754 RepID=A0AAD4B8P8_BOLED|nr:hypothetical protein L210DRAFT_3722646 [Boletus edulis BED1]
MKVLKKPTNASENEYGHSQQEEEAKPTCQEARDEQTTPKRETAKRYDVQNVLEVVETSASSKRTHVVEVQGQETQMADRKCWDALKANRAAKTMSTTSKRMGYKVERTARRAQHAASRNGRKAGYETSTKHETSKHERRQDTETPTSTALNLIPTLAVRRTQRYPQPPSGPNLPCRCRLPPRPPRRKFRAVLKFQGTNPRPNPRCPSDSTIPSTALSLSPTTQVTKRRPLPSTLIPTLAVHRTQRCPQPPSGPNLPCRCHLPSRSPSRNFRAVLRNFKSQPALLSSLPPISSGAEKFQGGSLSLRKIAEDVKRTQKACPESTRITILGLTQTCTHDTVRFPLPVGALQSIARSYAEQKELSGQLDSKRHTQSLLGDRIRTIKDPSEKQAVLGEAKTLKAEIMSLEEKVAAVEEKLLGLALHLPNDTHPEAPIGPDDAAITLSTHGPPVTPPSPERDHVTIGRALGLFEFKAAAIVTGSSWYYLLKESRIARECSH